MPGTVVTTSTRSAASSVQRSAAASYFVTGQTERGEIGKPLEITSMTDYVTTLGDRVAYGALYDDLQTHFEEGGTRVFVSRVVGPAAAVASRTLNDRAGTPVPTLRIDALGAGAWGAGVTVAIDAGTAANTFKISVGYSGAGNQGTEVYDNLASPADAVKALAQSAYVRAANLGSASASPLNFPALSAAVSLTGGSDDRASILATHYVAALDALDVALGSGAVAIPGQPSSSVGAGLIAHAVATRRLALTALAIGSSSAQAGAAAATLRGAVTAGSEYAGVFWPGVQIPDGGGSVRTITPEGYVAAVRARAHEQEGPARAPAGLIADARFVVGTELPVNKTLGDSLNALGVSVIRPIAGSIRLYGWRSLSLDTANYYLLTSRDVMNYIAVAVENAFEEFVFRTIDSGGRMFSDMQNRAIGILDPLRNAGQLYEAIDPDSNQRIDAGYSVDTGPSVNTKATLQANQARAEIAVRPSPSGELVIVGIAKVALTGTV